MPRQPRHPLMVAADRAIRHALDAAGHPARAEGDSAVVIRVRTNMPDRPSAESHFVGKFAPAVARQIRDAIAAELDGTIERDTASAYTVHHGSRQKPATVPLREAAEIIGVSTRAAESALRRAGIRSGYPRHEVERLAATRPGQGTRTDLKKGTGGASRNVQTHATT